MNHYRLTLAGMAMATTMLTANAYDISVKNTDGQIFRATVDNLDNITFDTAGSPLTFTGEQGNIFTAGASAEDVAVRFDASMYWIVAGKDETASWVRLSKNYGPAGENVIVLSLDANSLNAPRTATFSILCGFQTVEVSITQDVKDTVNFVEIPDDNFRNYILSNFDTNSDGRLSRKEAEAIVEIKCPDMGIRSMAGVRSMPNLTNIDCSYNSIDGTLDLSGLTKLVTAKLDHNVYEKLSLAGCSSLDALYANDNWKSVDYIYTYCLKTIDLTGCSALRYVRLEDNGLESIDLSDCVNLTDLMLAINNLEDIDLSSCTKLVNAHLRNNTMKGVLDMSHCPELQVLTVSEMELKGINLAGCSKLRQIGAQYNSIGSLDLSSCVALESLTIFSNELTEIDLSHNPDLQTLWVASNHLTSLDLSCNPRLKKLQGSSNEITGTLDLTNNGEIAYIEMYNNKIEAVKFTYSPDLKTIDFNDNLIRVLDATKAPNAEAVVAYNNKLEEVDLTASSAVTIINFDNNNLTELDLSGCSSLMIADLNRNKLNSLDVSGCSRLQELYVTFNNMKSFTAHDLYYFTILEIYNNQLERIDLKGCVNLDQLHFQNNNIEFFSPKGLDSVRYVDCRDNRIGSIDFTSNHMLQYAHGTGNPCKVVYLSEQAPNEQIVFDETCEIYVGKPKDFDDVGGSTWGDGTIKPWGNKACVRN